MLWESRSRQDILEVGGGILCGNRTLLTAWNTSSLVIDSLCDQAAKEDIAVVGLYCDFLAQQEQTVTNMMGAILKQLVGRGHIPEYLREAFHDGKKNVGGRGLRLPDLVKMLRVTIASLTQVFICIDALDECLPKHLPGLLGSLRDIVQELPRTRIFVAGRPHIKEDIHKYFTQVVMIPISPNANDIRSYLEMRLDMDPEPDAMSDDLRAGIIRIIIDRISDMCVRVFGTFSLPKIHAHPELHVDSSLFRSTLTQFWGR